MTEKLHKHFFIVTKGYVTQEHLQQSESEPAVCVSRMFIPTEEPYIETPEGHKLKFYEAVPHTHQDYNMRQPDEDKNIRDIVTLLDTVLSTSDYNWDEWKKQAREIRKQLKKPVE